MKKLTLRGMSYRHVLTLIILFLSHVSLFAETIEGTIIDYRTEQPIIGATISLAADEPEKILAVTDIDGNFNVQVNGFPVTLVVSYIGYQSKEYYLAQNTNQRIVISLVETSQSLDEVVVVGYGTQQRQKLTGAVATVNKDILNNNVSPTLDALLAGSVAGVSVTPSGQPGAASTIRIRGGNSVSASNAPLYVIDGIIYYKESGALDTGESGTGISGGVSPLSVLNPSDIESIEILKDVSATAIYGSRGANGVIIVTTKKGTAGRTFVKYGYHISFDAPSKKLDVLNATEWARYMKDYFYNKGGYTDDEILALGDGTNWRQDAVLRSSISQSHNLSITGGNENTRFALSGNIVDQNGIVLNTGYSRSGLRLNVDHRLSEQFTIGTNFNVSRSKQDGLTTTTGVSFN